MLGLSCGYLVALGQAAGGLIPIASVWVHQASVPITFALAYAIIYSTFRLVFAIAKILIEAIVMYLIAYPLMQIIRILRILRIHRKRRILRKRGRANSLQAADTADDAKSS